LPQIITQTNKQIVTQAYGVHMLAGQLPSMLAHYFVLQRQVVVMQPRYNFANVDPLLVVAARHGG
jgi:hypothetical protein